jgi:hypothetical protein
MKFASCHHLEAYNFGVVLKFLLNLCTPVNIIYIYIHVTISFPGVIKLGREPERSRPFNAEVKNECSYSSTPHMLS